MGELQIILLWLECFGRSKFLSVEFSRRPPAKEASKQASPAQPARREQTNKLAVEMNRQVLHRLSNCIGPHFTSPQRRRPYTFTSPPPTTVPPSSRATSPSLTLSSYRSHGSSTLLHLPRKRLRSSCSQVSTNPQTLFRESRPGASQLCPRPHTLAWICEQSSSTILSCSATLRA
jgi:hypothetical protein